MLEGLGPSSQQKKAEGKEEEDNGEEKGNDDKKKVSGFTGFWGFQLRVLILVHQVLCPWSRLLGWNPQRWFSSLTPCLLLAHTWIVFLLVLNASSTPGVSWVHLEQPWTLQSLPWHGPPYTGLNESFHSAFPLQCQPV